MAVNYKIYQGKTQTTNGMYYARATHHNTVSIKELAQTMQANCTVKYADIVAVLAELSDVMRTELLRSNKVRIDGLGTFKVGLRSKGSTNLEEFNPQKNIIGARILFFPETAYNGVGKRSKAMLSGLKLQEEATYVSLKNNDKTDDKIDQEKKDTPAVGE